LNIQGGSAIVADGAVGESGIQFSACGGNGAGMGGGGGGAGGVVRILSTSMSNAGVIVARGAPAGNCGASGGAGGNGHGSDGRIEIRASGGIGSVIPGYSLPQ